MFLKLLLQSIKQRKKTFLVASLSIALGTIVAGFLLTLSIHAEAELGKALKTYGANLILLPKKTAGNQLFLPLSTLQDIKKTFWKNQFIAAAPFLVIPVDIKHPNRSGTHHVPLVGTYFHKTIPIDEKERFESGVISLHPFWKISGRWPQESSKQDIVLGKSLAERIGVRSGSSLGVTYQGKLYPLHVAGILTTGTAEETQVFASLPLAQAMANTPGRIQQIHASVLFHPPDSLSQKDPQQMSPSEYDKWYCTPYVSSVKRQLETALPHLSAEPIEQVVQAEGQFLQKISSLLWILSLLAFLTAGLGMMSTLMSIILARQTEIGLMKALGATPGQFASLFLSEVSLMALCGGFVGYGIAHWVAQGVNLILFQASIPFHFNIFVLCMGLAWLVSLVSALWPMLRAMKIDPMIVLKEN